MDPNISFAIYCVAGYATNLLLLPIVFYLVKMIDGDAVRIRPCSYIILFVMIFILPFCYVFSFILLLLIYCCKTKHPTVSPVTPMPTSG